MSVEPGFPRAFGKYVLLRPFARGGMGELFIASSGELGGAEKLCLVKKVPDDHDSPGLSGRLLDEAKVAVRLNHSNLVQVFDAGQVDDDLYIAMEFIEGRDLRGVWNQTAEKRGRFPLEIALYLIREVVRALEYAHGYAGLNLVHRDIAPPNVLLSWHGAVKLTDFGLARSVLKNEKTAPGIVYGRVAYLAPEQARGEQADTRTDIFAAGVMLWELIAGRPLAEPIDDPVRSIERARHPRIVPPSRHVPGLSADIDAMVLKALAANRDQRYQTASDFRQAISDQLAKVGPKTDSSQMAAFLKDLFGVEIEKEVKEHERLLREDLAKWRKQKEGDKAARNDGRNKAAPPANERARAGLEKEAAPQRSGRSESPKIKPVETRNAPAAIKRDLGDEEQTKLMDRKKDPSSPERSAAAAALARAPVTVEVTSEEAVAELPGESLVGETLDGRYKVLRLIGTGGMGAVYEAEHTEIGKKVAVKVLHAQYSQQADLVARFRREARAATKIGHPHIVDVTDFGTTKSKNVYYVMERLEGIDLADLLHHERKIAPDRAAHISIQICRALGAAHQAGIIHRDLKPENIFLISRDGDADFVKVLDFGIAKHDFGNTSANQPRRLTGPGIAMGTPEYMAPEQAAGKAIDGRVDIYAVGAMLYEMLTGEPPHASTNVMEIFSRKANEAATPVRKINPKVSEQLEAVVAKALERDPNRRPKNMAAFEYELNKSLKGRRSAVATALGLRGDSEFLNADSDTPPNENDFLEQQTRPKNADWPSSKAPGWRQRWANWPESRRRSAQIVTVGVLAMALVGGWRHFKKTPNPTASMVPTPHAPAQPETRFLLEWAGRALDSGRFVSPPGDNVKELLDRIESIAPATVGASEIRDKAATLLRRRTESDIKSGDWSDAVHDLESLMALRPEDEKIKAQYARVLVLRAKARLAQRKLKSAAADLSVALSIAPDDLMAHTLTADVLVAEGNTSEAQAKYQWVLEQNAEFEPARRGLDNLTAPKPVRAAPTAIAKKKK